MTGLLLVLALAQSADSPRIERLNQGEEAPYAGALFNEPATKALDLKVRTLTTEKEMWQSLAKEQLETSKMPPGWVMASALGLAIVSGVVVGALVF